MDLRPVVRVIRTEVVPLGLPYSLVFTRVPTESLPRARERQAQLRVGSGLSVATACVRSYTAFNEAVEPSWTVLDIPGRHHYARRGEADYRALAAEVLPAVGFDTEKIRSDSAWLADEPHRGT